MESPMEGPNTVYADARVRLCIRSVCGPLPRKPKILEEFRPSLSGKQSEANSDATAVGYPGLGCP